MHRVDEGNAHTQSICASAGIRVAVAAALGACPVVIARGHADLQTIWVRNLVVLHVHNFTLGGCDCACDRRASSARKQMRLSFVDLALRLLSREMLDPHEVPASAAKHTHSDDILSEGCPGTFTKYLNAAVATEYTSEAC